LPSVVERFAKMRWGLVLMTGPTGSGKSTTLAAIIHHINRSLRRHIITIEDPIEFVHENEQSIMTQREVGKSARGFAEALKGAVREDPDVIMVGEMRDRETIQMAINAAETGFLVFGTLHTNSASKTIDRITNIFPADEQDNIRSVLGGVLRGVLAQQLVRRAEGGRVAAFEVLFGSPALANMIREGKTHQIDGLIQLGRKDGMITMDDSLLHLVREKVVLPEPAYEKAIDKKKFRATIFEEFGVTVGTDEIDEEEMLAILERQAQAAQLSQGQSS